MDFERFRRSVESGHERTLLRRYLGYRTSKFSLLCFRVTISRSWQSFLLVCWINFQELSTSLMGSKALFWISASWVSGFLRRYFRMASWSIFPLSTCDLSQVRWVTERRTQAEPWLVYTLGTKKPGIMSHYVATITLTLHHMWTTATDLELIKHTQRVHVMIKLV